MARGLDQIELDDVVARHDRRVARSTARAFAAAISALLISTLVLNRSSEALEPEGTVAGNSVQSGTVSLTDDDQGRSLFDLEDMAPLRPAERCIELSYTGSILPVEVTLLAESTGDLARYLDVRIERGDGARFGDCAEFRPMESLYDGTLADLIAEDALEVGTILNEGDEFGFRFTFELQDENAALGRSATADFVWEATLR